MYTLKNKPLPKYLTLLEVERLLNAPCENKIRDRLILRLLYKGGLRCSELTNLKIENISFTNRTIFIRKSKNDKDRITPIDDRTLELIKKYKKHRTKGILIQSNKRKTISNRQIRTLVKKYCAIAKIPPEKAHPHALRHSFAVHFYQATKDLRALQKALGHSSMYTTQIYLDLTVEDIRTGYNQMPDI